MSARLLCSALSDHAILRAAVLLTCLARLQCLRLGLALVPCMPLPIPGALNTLCDCNMHGVQDAEKAPVMATARRSPLQMARRARLTATLGSQADSECPFQAAFRCRRTQTSVCCSSPSRLLCMIKARSVWHSEMVFIVYKLA